MKPALAAIGASLDLWRVSVKPGKPFLFGRAACCAIFGLPGNPVSAFVTFLLFVRPAILKLMGANDGALDFIRVGARLIGRVENPGERPHYLRGVLKDGTFVPIRPPGIARRFRIESLECVAAGGCRASEFADDSQVIALLWE